MYSLLVSNQVEERAQGTFEVSSSRFLEYTSASISLQLKALSQEAIECIKSWPCVLMQEGRGKEEAHVAQITAIEESGSDIKIVVESFPCDSPILNDTLWRLRTDLDIGQFEFTRNHLAIKDRYLFPVLREAGHAFQDTTVARFENKPLPAPARSELMRARDVITDWSHTKIDDFLLEAGVDGLAADPRIGSRRDRANAILQFALQHPTATTAENSLFSAFIIRKASSSTLEAEPAAERSRISGPVSEAQSVGRNEESANRSPNRVFVVHGQNESARTAVVSFLSSIGLKGIVLHEQPNMGRHLLTKFIDEAELVTFAIILMTDDDVGGPRNAQLEPRARQNVILELGYFLAHLR
ncbi:MAG: hypothetical protein EYC70_06990 [Planctomycetota bacterium]|nr:MAG: hypothetical protein EYC70_06990 [Planctomycetota bacterium]